MAPRTPVGNTLFYGDNLAILREHVADASVDLIYLDPPFNSNATYNVLFKAPGAESSQAQIEAFGDTWHWNESAEQAFDEVMRSGNSDAAEMLRAMRSFLRENDMMAYLVMMAVRLIELHRVLKPTGSLYLHCDPTASHYLKILLDAVFGPNGYVAEIIWRRTNARGTVGRWPRLHDTIFHYAKTEDFFFRSTKVKADKQKLPHTLITAPDGKKYQTYELTGAGQTKEGESGKAWRGFDPNIYGRHWGNSQAQMDGWDALGLIHWPKDGGFPRRRDAEPFDPEARQVVVGSVWADIDRLNQTSKERLGYPTQKPLALLERIISASSNAGDLVLDPFCGCGTTVHAAQKLDRRWIGIDITHLAIHLIQRRLKDAFPKIAFEIQGVPKDLDGARALAAQDKYEFQKWALAMIDAQPYKGGKKGGDGGVDGFLYIKPDGKKTEKVIVSVKGGQSLNPAMVKDLIVTVEQEGAKMGVFLTLEPPTKGMVAQAAAAGFYKPEYGQFAKIQIVTVEDLFKPSNPLHLPWQDTSVFKKAKRERKPDSQSELDV
jgi:site-specific DNA-methyltransferase (adenine-specific)